MKGNIKNAWASAFLVFIAAFLGIILVQPFTVNAVDDTTAPEITYIGPTPANSTKINVNYVNVTVGITDSGNISVVLLEWNGVNNTMMNIAPGTWSLVMTNLSDGEYTYRVYANDTDGNMGISNMRVVTVSVSVTTYNYPLVLPGQYCLITLPLNDTTVTKASELAVKIGDNCTEVVKWDSSAQLYESYIPGVPLNDFDIRGGEGYFVNVNNPTNVVVTGKSWESPFTLSLAAGYNLIGIPLNDTTVTKASELAVKIGDNCTEVVKWDSSAQLYESYIPGVPLNDFDIRGGEGYFVNVNNPTNVVVTGKSWESPFTLSLAAGYNLIGIPLNDTSVTKASELAVKIGDNCTEVVKWDSSAQLYESYIPGVPLNDFDIRGGEGYFVNVNNPTSVVISGEAWKG